VGIMLCDLERIPCPPTVLLCCRCCQAPCVFFPLPSLSAGSPRPDRSGGFLWRWDLVSPTTFYPCGPSGPSARFSLRLSTRAGRSVRGDPISSPASWKARTVYTGRLHQHQGRRLTPPRNLADASCRTAPSGKTPLLRKRHRAMSHFRATAAIPMRLRRLPPPPKRARNQQLSALSG
jgi:hypothetical protein